MYSLFTMVILVGIVYIFIFDRVAWYFRPAQREKIAYHNCLLGNRDYILFSLSLAALSKNELLQTYFLSHVVNLLVNTRYTSSVSRYVLNFGSNIHFERAILLFQFQTIYLEIYNDSRFLHTLRLDDYYNIIIFEAIFGSIRMLNYNG